MRFGLHAKPSISSYAARPSSDRPTTPHAAPRSSLTHKHAPLSAGKPRFPIEARRKLGYERLIHLLRRLGGRWMHP
ncbi:hypothetical protein SAMN04487976_1108 [Xaviernesmea oryzae]|nr:hypothetical protein SAMN04487976_1108 [Xaviernesmea oryzae]